MPKTLAKYDYFYNKLTQALEGKRSMPFTLSLTQLIFRDNAFEAVLKAFKNGFFSTHVRLPLDNSTIESSDVPALLELFKSPAYFNHFTFSMRAVSMGYSHWLELFDVIREHGLADHCTIDLNHCFESFSDAERDILSAVIVGTAQCGKLGKKSSIIVSDTDWTPAQLKRITTLDHGSSVTKQNPKQTDVCTHGVFAGATGSAIMPLCMPSSDTATGTSTFDRAMSLSELTFEEEATVPLLSAHHPSF